MSGKDQRQDAAATWAFTRITGFARPATLGQKPEEIDEMKKLKERVRLLARALADANVDLAIERAYMEIACERAGIKDVADFKKKTADPVAH